MLFKALKYFWFKFSELEHRQDVTQVSGETYWLYRLYFEGLLAALACVGCLVAAFNQGSIDAMLGLIIASLVAAVVGLLEMLRLVRLLNEQVEFAELFYG